jgi:hypothetical protein
MQLRADDLYGYSYEYLHPGYCGPIYVNQVWSEDVSAGAYVDKYWDNGCIAYGPKRMIKAEIECESPEILNSILGQISNIVACPFDDPVKSITDKAQEELTSVINAKIVETLINENLDYITKELRIERENSKRYKLKHKVLYKC